RVRSVMTPDRCSNAAVERIRYFLGHYGETPAPVDPGVADRVLSRPGIDELRKLEPLHLDRARLRPGISDEELLLRLTMPEEQVDAIVPREPRSPVATLLREIAGRSTVQELRVEVGDRVVEWRR